MTVRTRLAAFGLVLVAAVAGGAALGAAVGPERDPVSPADTVVDGEHHDAEHE